MPITPAIIEAANAFRARILARERRAASAMVRYYGTAWQRLQGDIRTLSAEVEAQRLAGTKVLDEDIRDLERLRAIQAQAEAELRDFAQYADEAIVAQKRESIAAAEREAPALIEFGLPRGSGVDVSFYRMPRAAVEALAGQLSDGSPLIDVLNKYVDGTVEAFSDTMVTGMVAGWNPRKLAAELRNAYGIGLNDALRLSRAENLRAYRTASKTIYQDNADILTGWQRHAAKNGRTCMACIMLDGTIYALATDMDDHPTGRCAMLPLTKSYAELGIDAPEPQFQDESAREWFERQPEATQRDMMGSGKFAAWQDGRFTLEDIAQKITDPVWGDAWVPRTLYDLLGERAPVGTYAEWVAGQSEQEDTDA